MENKYLVRINYLSFFSVVAHSMFYFVLKGNVIPNGHSVTRFSMKRNQNI